MIEEGGECQKNEGQSNEGQWSKNSLRSPLFHHGIIDVMWFYWCDTFPSFSWVFHRICTQIIRKQIYDPSEIGKCCSPRIFTGKCHFRVVFQLIRAFRKEHTKIEKNREYRDVIINMWNVLCKFLKTKEKIFF